VASPGLPASTAPARTAAIFAFIAGAVGNHEHSALGAGRRAFVLIARRGAGAGINPARLHGHRRVSGRKQRTRDYGSFSRRHTVELEIFRGDEAAAEPARDVIQHGSGEANVGVGGDAAGFEAGVDQLVDENFERHAILQAD
jgi:hypothetical protein